MARSGARIGVDIGGTFTDVVLAMPDGRLFLNKTTTTPDDPSQAVAIGVAAVLRESGCSGAEIVSVVHGTTVASNTILQKVGARTGLLTTQGFRDVLEIARIRTPDMFDLTWTKPAPLVPRRWRLEARERIGADGSVVTPLDDDSVRMAAAVLQSEGVQAVAICFINSYVNPAHERRALAVLQEAAPDLLVTASCDVLPEMKEYERTSTAVVNAYILPAMRGYLSRIGARFAALGITAPINIMASNGGMIGIEAARERPVFAVGSGPAGGVAGAALLGPLLDARDIVVFDMGGTTAKASIIEDGLPSLVTEYEFRDGISSPSRFIKGAGYMLKVPAVDIAEVGSGGGSIARVDAGGLLVVGPQSAGGYPGPACYGRGTITPTVTDANMVLGLLNPHALAGGSLPVDASLSARAVETHIGRPLGLTLLEAAHGIRQVANVAMARAIRAVTVERGKDPREMTLMAFGGGGPLHAVDVARLLGITRVLISPASGVFSAAGMLAADAAHDFVHPVMASLPDFPPDDALQALAELGRKGAAALADEGYGADRIELRYAADLRYAGQSSQLTVPLPENFDAVALHDAFQALYHKTFDYTVDEPVELVNLRLTAIGRVGRDFDFATLRLDPRALAGEAGERMVSFVRGQPMVPARLVPRAALAEAGDAGIAGPAIIESYDTTLAVPPGCIARPAPAGCIAIALEATDA